MTDSVADLNPVVEPIERGDRHQRRREIAMLVGQQGRVTVEEIKERFGVSGVTARSDLDALAGTGDVVRSHGGAISAAQSAINHSIHLTRTPSDEQTRIAQAAVALIGSLESVMLCPGETAIEMAKLMRNECPDNVTVITYSLQIASYLSEVSNVSLVMLGGLYCAPSGTFLGPHAEQMMKSLHAGHCFLNTPGITVETGITTSDIMEAHLNQRMIEAASQVTVLAELKSFGSRSLALIADLEKIDRIICDSSVSPGHVKALRERGVEVMLV